ncbi:MAG: endonuclease/exonuclease/phosphatase family protein [Parabacteroides sp.]
MGRWLLWGCLFLWSAARLSAAEIPFRVMSYNVENLFDTVDDPARADEEFLPAGTYHWTPKRYQHKLRQLAKVILAAGEWDTPAIVGLCEVENDTVVQHLIHRTPLRSQRYRYCLADCSDPRGINVALLYQPDKFKYLSHRSISVRFTRTAHKATRQILHVSGQIASGDTLDLFVCHFPSRSGGQKETEQDRLDAANTVRNCADSLERVRCHPLVLVMGDFNDTPVDRSLADCLTATSLRLLLDLSDHATQGTHKYQGSWNQLDHLVANRAVAEGKASLRYVAGSASVFSPSFLLTTDRTGMGKRPFRTYLGRRYEGGFSDHLPVLADFRVEVDEPASTKMT